MTQPTFEQESADHLRGSIRFIGYYMSVPLYLFFWLADLLFVAEKAWVCLAIRSLIIPICLVSIFISQRISSKNSLQKLALFAITGHGAIITAIIYLDGGFNSGYYAGLNLIILGATFVPLTKLYRVLLAFGVFGPYYLTGMLHPPVNAVYYKVMTENSFFIFSTLTISWLIGFFNNKLMKKEFDARENLQKEIASRDGIIKTKTSENVNFQLLSRQFSPQVIKAISLGKVGDIKPIQRQKICVIFVDIEGSTSRIIRLDKDDIAKVISMFMDDVMSILLKYDITIDKFLGDGVLAFANHPNVREDYVERVVNAALEIRSQIMARRCEYIEYWKNELNVTIGIDVGYANVGIYGANNVLQTYTAIGEVVNLAKRFSSAAASNQILVSNNVVKMLTASDYQIASLGEKHLKGFENDIINIYEIKSKTWQQQPGGIDLCPFDNGVLHLVKNSLGIYVLTCRECGYVLDKPNRASHQTSVAA